MDGTRELVNPAQVGAALLWISVLALLTAPLLFWFARQRRAALLTRAALVTTLLVLLFPLWLVYNAIEDRFGLDSVAALLINLALFAFVGLAAGLALRRLWPADAIQVVEANRGGTEKEAGNSRG